MVKLHSVRKRYFITCIFALLILITTLVIAGAETKELQNQQTDIITIDLPNVPGSEAMHAVTFFHDQHTDILKKEEDCSTCHLKNKDSFIFKFKRKENSTPKTDMEIYHKNCISCHIEKKAEAIKAGPVTEECRACHNSQVKTDSFWKAIDFDKSLHYTHEQSKIIPSENGTNCQACHHLFNEKLKTTYYKKGEEESCIYCHTSKGKKDVSSIKEASHNACINCHESLKIEKKTGGPTNCKGCHSTIEQEKIKTLTKIPRLKRNQPDHVLITGYGDNTKLSQELVNSSMNPVAFNHKFHESSVKNCKSCHHESLKGCTECHTVDGNTKGDFISLESAMHNRESQHSCVSCHNQRKNEKQCTGCHSKISKKEFSNITCAQCHEVDKSQITIDSIQDMDETIKLASKTTNIRAESYDEITKKIPEKVVISSLSNEYKPVNFPHLKVFNKLKINSEKSRLAKSFHKNDQTLCMGCHHNSPSSLTPVKCQSCHTKQNKSGSKRPDLKAAYHGQCISCHNKMKIKTPVGTDCIACHEKIKK